MDDHYDDHSMKKWNDYDAPPKRTARQQYVYEIHNSLCHVQHYVRHAKTNMPDAAKTPKIMEEFAVLEELIEKKLEQWNPDK